MFDSWSLMDRKKDQRLRVNFFDDEQISEVHLGILKFVYSQWTIYSYYELHDVQRTWICNLQPATVFVAKVIRRNVDI